MSEDRRSAEFERGIAAQSDDAALLRAASADPGSPAPHGL